MAGATIADGAKLEKTFQQLADEVKKNGRTAALVTISAETYQDIHLHVVSTPTPDPQLTPLVGDTLEAAVGIGDDKVLVAVGRDAAKTLKKAIDQLKTTAGKEVPPLEIRLAVGPIAKFVAEVGDDPQVKAYRFDAGRDVGKGRQPGPRHGYRPAHRPGRSSAAGA